VCDCVHGTCTAYGVCICYVGFEGTTCNKSTKHGFGTVGLVLTITLPVLFIIAFLFGAGMLFGALALQSLISYPSPICAPQESWYD
jgi:hypothetical protein